ncbi:MAG: sigma-70 family RNA polymerase sigma factor [Myxococcaceae bacterium]|nr:sigma-70 family RNA polymerase sigma factor [Myxococcaceae bacterium]
MAADIWQAYEAELGPVCAFLRRCGARDAADLAHDTFMVAFQRRATFEKGRPLRPWLFGIALGLWRNQQTKASSVRETDAPLPEVADLSPSLDESLEQRRRREALARVLERLDTDQRVAFVWHDIEERPVAELAENLGVPTNTIYSRLRIARQKVNAAFAAQARKEVS